MPVLLRARSPLNPPRHPVLVVTFRRRECCQCGKRARVTLYSPSTALWCGFRQEHLRRKFGCGQCCIRCTRELRSP